MARLFLHCPFPWSSHLISPFRHPPASAASTPKDTSAGPSRLASPILHSYSLCVILPIVLIICSFRWSIVGGGHVVGLTLIAVFTSTTAVCRVCRSRHCILNYTSAQSSRRPCLPARLPSKSSLSYNCFAGRKLS